jgi:urea transport system permease protein
MRTIVAALLAICLCAVAPACMAQTIQDVLQDHREAIERSSRTTIGPAIDALVESGLPQVQRVLQRWQAKEMWLRKADGQFYYGTEIEGRKVRLFNFQDDTPAGEVDKGDLDQLKPNSGIRAVIGAALVRFQLADPSPERRRAALQSIQRDPDAGQLAPLAASIADETDPAIRAEKEELLQLLTIAYDPDPERRVAAIEAASGGISLDLRATLNPLVATRRLAIAGDVPADLNIARTLTPGSSMLSPQEAYALLVAGNLAEPRITDAELAAALAAHIEGGRVGGVPVADLGTVAARERAYAALAGEGRVPPRIADADVAALLASHTFLEAYAEPSPEVTAAANKALKSIATNVAFNEALDLALDALSLASIFFLAAIGLAITFGVMGVINMAHGEFIMMGAYTGFVVQQIVPNHTASILLAIPLAFAVTFAAGVAMERLVIRWLYNRPLETLLATFGISIALQQLAKNIFGTQARPLTAPAWLDGAWVINDVVSISTIRIAIFILALIFLGIFLFVMRHTRLGLETRAVTQNPRMAASMGINPGRVNMLTFGLGSGIAGIAGVAIGLFAKVTSELGGDYIVQSFMTVVVGGVGNIWGALAGATMIGFLQKGIEWFNPSNTLAAKTYMIIFIILFIQFRPRGIVALKGRAAGD